jgi:hypothetical protein
MGNLPALVKVLDGLQIATVGERILGTDIDVRGDGDGRKWW